MGRLLALEWDEHEARVAVANARNGEATIEQAFTVALRAASEQTASQDIGGKIGAALSARHVGRVESLVAVGRPSIELRNLSLPPAPDDELPDMVRFQALREFNALGDDWPLDFLPISGSATEPRSVLAAAISPDLIEPIQATCQAAGLKPGRLVLRPCAAASLLVRLHPAATDQVRLLVDLLSDEADLTVLAGDQVVFLRTARLPSDTNHGEHVEALLSEIRRTSVAVQNRFGGQRVEAIYLCGDDREQTALAAKIGQELGLPTEEFDPFAGLKLAPDLSRTPPGHPGRFAPLLGMLLDEAAGTPPALDFLNPRRKPPPASHRRTLTRAATIAAAVLAVAAIFGWFKLSSLDAQIRSLTDEANKLAAAEKLAVATEKKVAEIDKWAGGDLVWLDELAELSRKLPSAKDVLLTKLNWNPRPKGAGGELAVQFYVRNPSTTEVVEQSLRDARHRVDVEAGHDDTTRKGYQWKFDSKITIDPPTAGKDNRPAAAQRPAAGAKAPTPPAAPASPDAPPTEQVPEDATAPAEGATSQPAASESTASDVTAEAAP